MARQNRADRQARSATPKAKQADLATLSRDDLYAKAKAANLTGLSRATKDELIAALSAAPPKVESNGGETKVEARERRGREAAARHMTNRDDPKAPKHDPNAAIRSRLATDECKALVAWETEGKKGKQPVTPNYDALSAQYWDRVSLNPPAPKAARTRQPKAEGEASTRRGPRGAEAVAEKQRLDGKRGRDNRKVTDDELLDHIRKVKKAHPDSSMSDERMYARWIERLSFGWGKFADLWDRA